MGYWCWTKIRGKISRLQELSSDGPLSTYQQQVWDWSSLHQNECPCQAVITDLLKEITKWQEDGKTLILMMDFIEVVHLTSGLVSW